MSFTITITMSITMSLQKNFRSNIGKYHENLYSKFNNIDEFDKFLERFKLLNLKQE